MSDVLDDAFNAALDRFVRPSRYVVQRRFGLCRSRLDDRQYDAVAWDCQPASALVEPGTWKSFGSIAS